MARDPYQELGVSRGASHDEIRKAFRKLAKQHHPDTNPGTKAADDRFKQVSAAVDIIGAHRRQAAIGIGRGGTQGAHLAHGTRGVTADDRPGAVEHPHRSRIAHA